jgi:hypothetical protein
MKREMLHISVNIDRETAKAAKIQAIVENMSFQEWIAQAVIQKLTRENNQDSAGGAA